MSVMWKELVGYDGDFMYPRLAVNYWCSREDFVAGLDRQLAELRKAMVQERDRLMAEDDES